MHKSHDALKKIQSVQNSDQTPPPPNAEAYVVDFESFQRDSEQW